eukprot:113207-Amphidinium_carterae.1
MPLRFICHVTCVPSLFSDLGPQLTNAVTVANAGNLQNDDRTRFWLQPSTPANPTKGCGSKSRCML